MITWDDLTEAQRRALDVACSWWCDEEQPVARMHRSYWPDRTVAWHASCALLRRGLLENVTPRKVVPTDRGLAVWRGAPAV